MTIKQFYDLTEAQIVYIAESATQLKRASMEFQANLHNREMKPLVELPKLSIKSSNSLDKAGQAGFEKLFGGK